MRSSYNNDNSFNFRPFSIEFALFLSAIFISIQFFNLAFVPEQNTRVLISDLMEMISAIFGSIFIISAYLKTKKANNQSAGGWFFISIGSVIWALGALSFFAVEVIFGKLPYPSLPDFFYLIFYPFMIIGLLKLPSQKMGKKEILNFVLEMSAIIISSSLLVWNFSLDHTFNALKIKPDFALVFSFIYSVLDVALLFSLLLILLRQMDLSVPFMPVVIMIIACFCLIFSDLMQASIITYANFVSGTVADIGWCVFTAMFAVAGALQIKEVTGASSEESKGKLQSLPRYFLVSFITSFWLLGIFVLLIWGIFIPLKVSGPVLITGSVAVFLLVVVRQFLTLLENRQLLADRKKIMDNLEQSNGQLVAMNLSIERETAQMSLLNDLLVASEQKLRSANQTKDKFFSIIAHDLKNPIHGFQISLTTLIGHYDKLSSAEVLDKLHSLRKSSTEFKTMLENLLSWANSQRGRIDFEPSEHNLNKVVDAVLSILNENIAQKKLKVFFDDTHEKIAFFDWNLIKTVMLNLISNAVKFSYQNGSITIDLKPEGSVTKISIADTGIGMSESDTRKLFREDISNSEIGNSSEKGTGLGLILCKEFVEMHAGDIFVESKEGIGTTFTFTIPNRSKSS